MIEVKIIGKDDKEYSLQVPEVLREGDTIERIDDKFYIVRHTISKHKVEGAEDWGDKNVL